MKPEKTQGSSSLDTSVRQDYCPISPEEYLDKNFGRGAWVRDPFGDVFIVVDPDYIGRGRSYIVLDRALRRMVRTIPANEVH